jgi:hypothetical protein
VIDLIATSAALVRNLESAASIDLADDADKLAILAVFRDPDVRAALDTAGPRLRDMWLVLELKGYGLRRTEVKKVLTTAVRHLTRLSRYSIKILKAAEKELVKKPTPHRAPRDDATSRVRLASTSVLLRGAPNDGIRGGLNDGD